MLSLIRVDDRLIHGQVMAVWVRVLNITHIIVIDDETAGDSFSQQVMQVAMPAGIHLSITAVCNAAALLRAIADTKERALVLLRDIESAVRLHGLYPFTELNVGGSGMRQGRRLIWRSIALSPQQMYQLIALQDAGVDVYMQMIPSDEKRRQDSTAWRERTLDS